MIIYRDDWNHYPTAIVDYNTTNESFIKYCEVLDSMGVQNSAWPLQLMQPELSGIDVYKDGPDLDFETKSKISLECTYNPFYYLREVARIPPVSSIDPVPFIANRGNMSLFWTFMNRIDSMLIQIRQTGKSVGADTLTLWAQCFAATNMKQQLITKDNQLRVENILRLRNMKNLLPKWLVYDDPKDAANQTIFTYNIKGNRLLTAVGQNSEDQALNVGRGITSAFLQNDEGPFTSFIWITLPAAIASGNTARENAILNNQPSGTVFTTTAGKIDSKPGAYMYKIYQEATRFNEKFMDLKNVEELKELVKFNSAGEEKGRRLFLLEYDHLQLGKTDEWLKEKLIETGAVGEDADRDFFNIWTCGGVHSPLPTDVLEAIAKSERLPDYVELTPFKYIINWYLKEEVLAQVKKNVPLIIGIDTSDAIGRDNIEINITNPYTLKTVGTCRINYSSLLTAATFVAKLLTMMPKAIAVIEKKSSGMTFIDSCIAECVKQGHDPFKRLFNRLVENMGKGKNAFEIINKTPLSRRDVTFYDAYRDQFGFNTSGNSRDLLYGTVFTTAAKKLKDHIYDKNLSGQIRKLVVKNGRLDHQSGEHDDAVFAWLLSQWFIMCGKTLSHYGIDTLQIPARITEGGFVGNAADIRKQQQQIRVKQLLNETIEKLNGTNDPFTMGRIESNIEKLISMLEISEEESGSMASMFDSVKHEKKRNKLIERFRSNNDSK